MAQDILYTTTKTLLGSLSFGDYGFTPIGAGIAVCLAMVFTLNVEDIKPIILMMLMGTFFIGAFLWAWVILHGVFCAFLFAASRIAEERGWVGA